MGMAAAVIAHEYCERCGEWVDRIRRASDDTEVIVNATPHNRGDWVRVSSGRERGKYIRLSGDARADARDDGVILYIEHGEVCGRG